MAGERRQHCGHSFRQHHLLPNTFIKLLLNYRLPYATNELKLADASLLTVEDCRDCSLTQTNKGTHLIGHEAITGLPVSPTKGAADGDGGLAGEIWVRQ